MFSGDGTQASEPFVPTWTTSGTAPTMGSSGLVGTFERLLPGRRIFVEFRLLAGSGVGFGTGTLRFATPSGLPPLAEYITYLKPVGRAVVDDGTNRRSMNVIISNLNYVDLRDDAYAAVSGTSPSTLGVGDTIAGWYTYEADI